MNAVSTQACNDTASAPCDGRIDRTINTRPETSTSPFMRVSPQFDSRLVSNAQDEWSTRRVR